MHDYIKEIIENIELQMKKNQQDANAMLVANAEYQRIVNELRTLK